MSIADKLTTIAENQQRVYDAGYNKGESDAGAGAYKAGYDVGHQEGFQKGKADGIAEGFADGFADGKQAEYDRFWDAFQAYGSRKYYDLAFYSSSGAWDDDSYQPKYDILCEGSDAFRQTFNGQKKLTSTKVPIRCKNTRLVYTFQNCSALKTIPLLTLEGITQISHAFNNCNALEDITVEGAIPLSIEFAQSTKLTKASIESIMEALSLTATGQTLTLSKTAVDNAFHDPEGEDVIGSASADWNSLMESKPNWTITLV